MTNANNTLYLPTMPPANLLIAGTDRARTAGHGLGRVSGIARDLLAEAMLRIEAVGYPIVLTFHDEVVCEVPEGFGGADEFTRSMTRKPAWALELPIAASAWTGSRYCK